MLAQILGIICCLDALKLVNTAPTVQQPLIERPVQGSQNEGFTNARNGRKLHGKFLQITDFHPDPFYKPYSSTEVDKACHRGEGPAGALGAETTDCDSPISLINATFEWVDKHVKDSIDFIVWTGDSARHDNDEEIPRTSDQVIKLNELLVNKFEEIFRKKDDEDPANDFTVPIIPTFGNNDILPHNIFADGPNQWTKEYLHIWRKFIPEEQRHGFERGGWFFVEVIPNKLAVFSLNTLYFFDSNTAVDGCAENTEPGYAQMDWLRVQLQFLRQRGMKAILTGHVAPARTESKMSWDETCWQKYTFWMQQYRDVVVGSLYGHMNIDHFMLQDSEEIDLDIMEGEWKSRERVTLDDNLSIQSSAEYLSDLRTEWENLPKRKDVDITSEYGESPVASKIGKRKHRRSKKSRQQKYFDKIGGPWGERFSISLVSPSVVPNYYPTIRVFEYNVTGLDALNTAPQAAWRPDLIDMDVATRDSVDDRYSVFETGTAKMHKESKAKKKYKKPKFTMPQPPSKASPPGPAYSPQTFTWIGYTQYYANLTTINDDFTPTLLPSDSENPSYSDLLDFALDSNVDQLRWHEGKHSGKQLHRKKGHKKFKFEVEYDTRTDSSFNMTDLTVRNYVELASRMGQYKPRNATFKDGKDNVTHVVSPGINQELPESEDVEWLQKKSKKDKKKRKRRRRKEIERLWVTFVRRAYVGSRDDEYLREEFGDGSFPASHVKT